MPDHDLYWSRTRFGPVLRSTPRLPVLGDAAGSLRNTAEEEAAERTPSPPLWPPTQPVRRKRVASRLSSSTDLQHAMSRHTVRALDLPSPRRPPVPARAPTFRWPSAADAPPPPPPAAPAASRDATAQLEAMLRESGVTEEALAEAGLSERESSRVPLRGSRAASTCREARDLVRPTVPSSRRKRRRRVLRPRAISRAQPTRWEQAAPSSSTRRAPTSA